MTLRVYLIDDEKDLCEIFKELFSTDSIHIISFTDPSNAIVEARNNPPDLVFIDYRIAYITGDEVALSLDDKIPKILLTGEINVTVTYNYDKIISKPYTEEDIVFVLNKYLKLKIDSCCHES